MTTLQTKSTGALQGTFGRAPMRYLGNGWFLLVAAGLALVAIAAVSRSWLVAAGIASVVLSVLPCLVMCGLGLCLHKFIGGSGSAQVSGAAVADAPESAAQAATESPAAYGASCCGGGSFSNSSNARTESDTESKEKINA